MAHKWYSEEVKRQALALYLDGLGFRSIGRLLNGSPVAVYQWIKQARLDVLATTEIEVVEMDEGHPYVGSKKKRVGCGLPLTDEDIVFSMSLSVHATQTQVNASGKG